MQSNESPQFLLERARSHERAGRNAAALAAYQHLLRQWPELPDTWFNLARLQRRSGLPDAALASYQTALSHGISQPEEVHLNRGVIYAEDLRQPDPAERELAAALRLNPHYVPALLNLGNLHEDRGYHADALAVYARLLAIEPAHAEALSRHAGLQLGVGPDDAVVERLRRALVEPAATPSDRASLGFALGKLLDAAGAYDAAFQAYQSANQSSRASVPPQTSRYDRQAHEKLVDSLLAVFATAPKDARPAIETADDGANAAPPVFICGMFRSGSTLTEQVLAAHSQVVAGGEISALPELIRTRLGPYPESILQRSPQQLVAMASAYRQHLARIAPTTGLVHMTDKRPENYLHIGLIKTLFPEAKIIHTTRSPLDNALSIYFLHLDPALSYALDLGDIGHHYREYRRLMAHWRRLYGNDILDFDYDAFVAEPRPAVARLLAFCGLGWEDACMDFHRVDNAVRTASVWQVRRPLYQSSSGRWRHYESHLQPLREMLQGLSA
ncbi:MAG: sulfotransferase [Pseudomonadota bacterium]|nr:sulfotransferase [Pseudomonadota bacterium]